MESIKNIQKKQKCIKILKYTIMKINMKNQKSCKYGNMQIYMWKNIYPIEMLTKKQINQTKKKYRKAAST